MASPVIKELKAQPHRKRIVKTVCSINAPRPKKKFAWDTSVLFQQPQQNAEVVRAASPEKKPRKKPKTSTKRKNKFAPVSKTQLEIAEEFRDAPAEEKPKKKKPMTSFEQKEKKNVPVSDRQPEIDAEVSKVASAEIEISKTDVPNLKARSAPPRLPKTKPSTTLEVKAEAISGRKRAIAIVECKEASKAAIDAAFKFAEANMTPGTQSVVKTMKPANVYRVFWLGLPKAFCKPNLPKAKSEVTLVDNNGKEFKVVYIPEKFGLSGGWVEFARKKQLHDGDAVLFESIERSRLKVHIFRSTDSGDITEIE
ncbi:B3 domain-containing protein At5g42700-like [Argentina anserina]|uniref:B3 domain-containing protein At5g42700-like n=1 Tax=Argentina anserina TaxID=57926 RepID=UPI0021769052|nr:B3 domain-containing protein At5g42700-like [Potentilla anserina]